MARQTLTSLALAAIAVTGSTVADDTGVGPTLTKDESFVLDLAADINPDLYHPRAFFAVCGDTLLVSWTEIRSHEPRTFEYSLNEGPISGTSRIAARAEFPSGRPLGHSFQADRSAIGYFDGKESALVFLEPGGGRFQVSSGQSFIRNFGRFANGNMIVVSRNMRLYPFESYASLEEDGEHVDQTKIDALSRKWRKYDLFLTDPNLRILRPLAEKRIIKRGTTARLSEQAVETITGRYVRVSVDQTKTAVFSRHLPGIDIYSQEGEILGTYRHPGKGRHVLSTEPMASVVPAGTKIFYQDDVAIAGGTLFVAETSRQKLWRIDLKTSQAEDTDLDFYTMSMQLDGDYLYMVDMVGRLHRYRLGG